MSKITVAEQIRNLARLYESMVEAANVLETIGKKEQVIAECDAAIESSRGELSKIKDDINAAKLKLKERRDEIENEARTRAAFASKMIEDAVAEANGQAAQILAVAKAQADDIVRMATGAAEGRKQQLDREMSGINAQLGDARGELALIAQAKNDATAELTDINGKLDAARAKIKALMA